MVAKTRRNRHLKGLLGKKGVETMAYRQEAAETIALQALGWLAENEELLPNFMAASGVSPDDLRSRAADADFLGSVLDFILMDDQWVVGFCDAAGLRYDAPLQARQALPGGQVEHWT